VVGCGWYTWTIWYVANGRVLSVVLIRHSAASTDMATDTNSSGGGGSGGPGGLLTLRPLEIDFRNLREPSARARLRATLRDTLSPMFALTHHGLEEDIHALMALLLQRCGGNVVRGFASPPQHDATAAATPGLADEESQQQLLLPLADDVPSCVTVEMEDLLSAAEVSNLHQKLAAVAEEVRSMYSSPP
jgi:hypothetical protein